MGLVATLKLLLALLTSALRGIDLTTSTPCFWHAMVRKVSQWMEWEIASSIQQ